eukprot:TRINITY_DN1654_c0_g1_i2.p1 TRINITY_DN1654_c0_g1~~TRINITY_DN1654_c0_g1_i2.p1  ORF type:complete len:359 (-),score=88.51 TRINITY_DN1654_c0_g1_i2:907-1983(-)
MSSFTNEEVKALEAGGNAVAERTLLARWSPSDMARPDASDGRKLRQFMRAMYKDRRWYDASGQGAPVQHDSAPERASPRDSRVSPRGASQGSQAPSFGFERPVQPQQSAPRSVTPPRAAQSSLLDFDTPQPVKPAVPAASSGGFFDDIMGGPPVQQPPAASSGGDIFGGGGGFETAQKASSIKDDLAGLYSMAPATQPQYGVSGMGMMAPPQLNPQQMLVMQQFQMMQQMMSTPQGYQQIASNPAMQQQYMMLQQQVAMIQQQMAAAQQRPAMNMWGAPAVPTAAVSWTQPSPASHAPSSAAASSGVAGNPFDQLASAPKSDPFADMLGGSTPAPGRSNAPAAAAKSSASSNPFDGLF